MKFCLQDEAGYFFYVFFESINQGDYAICHPTQI
uniref:Uncharacterized protein n=1 Tax=Anguilla anguilla TaxID=7936 RepID=A0A0E9UJK5_ANGAN